MTEASSSTGSSPARRARAWRARRAGSAWAPAGEAAAARPVMGAGRAGGRPVWAVASDYTVHAGTQSAVNHLKIDHMFDLAIRHRLPAICWLGGGGARPPRPGARRRV